MESILSIMRTTIWKGTLFSEVYKVREYYEGKEQLCNDFKESNEIYSFKPAKKELNGVNGCKDDVLDRGGDKEGFTLFQVHLV